MDTKEESYQKPLLLRIKWFGFAIAALVWDD